MPATQFVHAAESDTPDCDDHVPATQFVQRAPRLIPDCDDHVPASQLMQVAVEVAPPTDDHVPALQFVQPTLFCPVAFPDALQEPGMQNGREGTIRFMRKGSASLLVS